MSNIVNYTIIITNPFCNDENRNTYNLQESYIVALDGSSNEPDFEKKAEELFNIINITRDWNIDYRRCKVQIIRDRFEGFPSYPLYQ